MKSVPFKISSETNLSLFKVSVLNLFIVLGYFLDRIEILLTKTTNLSTFRVWKKFVEIKTIFNFQIFFKKCLDQSKLTPSMPADSTSSISTGKAWTLILTKLIKFFAWFPYCCYSIYQFLSAKKWSHKAAFIVDAKVGESKITIWSSTSYYFKLLNLTGFPFLCGDLWFHMMHH